MAYLLLFFATSDFYRTNTDNQWYMYIKNEICQIYIFIVCSMKKKITFIIERQRTLCYSMFHCSCLLLTFLICYYNLFAIITYLLLYLICYYNLFLKLLTSRLECSWDKQLFVCFSAANWNHTVSDFFFMFCWFLNEGFARVVQG